MLQTKELPNVVALRAEELFNQGFNCCESIISACVEVLTLSLPRDVSLMGKFFGKGVVGSGCICGALAGGVMIFGYASGQCEIEKEAVDSFRREFINRFGSTCCRVIRKKQSVTGRWSNKECRELTKFTASMLIRAIQSGRQVV